MPMSEPWNDCQQLTLFAEAFPVSPIRSLVPDWVPPTTATSGPTSADSFASLNPDGSWRKTCQGSCQLTLDGSTETYSEIWPRAGTTRNGTAYRRPPLAPLTDAIASGSWPTPCAEDAKNVPYQKGKAGQRYPMLLGAVDPARMWPTPAANDALKSNMRPETLIADYEKQATRDKGPLFSLATEVARSLAAESSPLPPGNGASGSLNPVFVEWLMGYPLGWSALEASAIASSRKSRNGSRAGSSRQKG